LSNFPESEVHALLKLIGVGILLPGDPVGPALKLGVMVRRMDLVPGAIAAQAIKEATAREKYSVESLVRRAVMLRGIFREKDFETLSEMPRVLENP
jgi:hypothetical protein